MRQGDPLHPFLFSLCLEVLSRSFKHMSRSPFFGFHPNAKISVLLTLLAGDLLIFSKGDVKSIILIMNCLNGFGDMAGTLVNQLKSNIYMAGVDDRSRQRILESTGFLSGLLPFRYLVIPLASSKLRVSDYSMLLDVIASKINSWPRHSLSHAGMIRSVLQG